MSNSIGHERPNHKTDRDTKDTIEWYRSLGQSNPMIGLDHELVGAAAFVEEHGDGIFLENKVGKINESQPAILDAACMFAEAARVCTDLKRAIALRQNAQRIALGILEKDNVPTALRVDAWMLAHDAEFGNLHDLLVNGKISIESFTDKWQACHESSLIKFNEELPRLNAKDDFSAGKFGEWFALNTFRHLQLEKETIDQGLFRATSTREDCAVKRPRSGNFDIAYDTRERDNWSLSHKLQIKVAFNEQEPVLDYDRDIDARVLRFNRGESFTAITRRDMAAMVVESRSLTDYGITLNKAQEAALKDAKTRVSAL